MYSSTSFSAHFHHALGVGANLRPPRVNRIGEETALPNGFLVVNRQFRVRAEAEVPTPVLFIVPEVAVGEGNVGQTLAANFVVFCHRLCSPRAASSYDHIRFLQAVLLQELLEIRVIGQPKTQFRLVEPLGCDITRHFSFTFRVVFCFYAKRRPPACYHR